MLFWLGTRVKAACFNFLLISKNHFAAFERKMNNSRKAKKD
jgi:hypothetical protein